MTNPLTILWKFPTMRESHVWRIVRVDGDCAFLLADTGLAIAAVDTSIGAVTLTCNDSDGARVRVFDGKENLMNLIESMIAQYLAEGVPGDGGFAGDQR